MKELIEKRGIYQIKYYEVEITSEMKKKALKFACDIILSDNQYSRLLPEHILESNDVGLKNKIEIQRTYMGKLGELAFLKYLNELSIYPDTTDMFVIYKGQDKVDSFDFITPTMETIDVKTGFRTIHKRLLVNLEQFNGKAKNYYVAVKLNTRDVDPMLKLVDWNSVTLAKILGYAEYDFLKNHCEIRNFGEGNAKYLEYKRLLGIDKLIKKCF